MPSTSHCEGGAQQNSRKLSLLEYPGNNWNTQKIVTHLVQVTGGYATRVHHRIHVNVLYRVVGPARMVVRLLRVIVALHTRVLLLALREESKWVF